MKGMIETKIMFSQKFYFSVRKLRETVSVLDVAELEPSN